MRMHCFEVHSAEKQQLGSLYLIRSTIDEFNSYTAACLEPGRYLVIDELINYWLGVGMPDDLKKISRNPHVICRKVKTLAAHHTFCIVRIDPVGDPKPKE